MEMEQAKEAKRVKEANELLLAHPGMLIEIDGVAAVAKTITDADVINFAGISGDTNPVHLNHEFASETKFEGRVAHGMLTASFISTVIGTKLPGPGCIYVSQNLRFMAPVKVGDTVTATCTVSRLIPEKHMIEMETICSVGGKTVLDGQATILVPTKAGKA